MKHLQQISLFTTVIFLSTLASAQTKAPMPSPLRDSPAQEAYADIQKTIGFVPEFLKMYPESGISGAWMEMKSLDLNPSTALSAKSKDLIGLAVSAQVPCTYCIYYHTESAKSSGVNNQELREAVAMAAVTRHWSTWLNGRLQTFDSFKREADTIMTFFRLQMNRIESGIVAMQEPIEVTDSASAYKDIERTLGSVPIFLKTFPILGIAGAWRNMKDLQLNANTALSGKEKELIGVAVASQIPCQYCVYFHTEAAKLNGATEAEIDEAIAMSAMVRHWSTVLNGLQIKEKKFQSEVDKMLARNKQRVAVVK